MSDQNELQKNLLKTFKDVTGRTAISLDIGERMLCGEILTLQHKIKFLEKKQEEPTVVSFKNFDELQEVANNPELKAYMMVCFWKDNTVVGGWGGKEIPTHMDLVFGVEVLKNRVFKEVFES